MTKPLNPQLYRRLQHLFGRVKRPFPHAGEAFIGKAGVGVDDEPLLHVEHWGETYPVCCPFCNDTRYRLYVCHMYGKRDLHGRRMNFLVICFNEGCLAKYENRQELFERLQEADDFLEEAQVAHGIVVPEEAREVEWPGPCQRLDTLRPTHPARNYLCARGFDPDLLGRKYTVSYCHESHFFLAKNRIIIPIFDGAKLKGWQARYIGELPWKDPDKKRDLPPKYFSCPGAQFRSRCIYNWDRVKQWETGIIVEGPMDVWRFGAMAGGIFGNTMTTVQRRRFAAAFRYRSGVLLLDPEEYDSAPTRKLLEYMQTKLQGRFCAVKLPVGTDPGSLGRDFLREFVREQATEQGVTVTYRKVRATA